MERQNWHSGHKYDVRNFRSHPNKKKIKAREKDENLKRSKRITRSRYLIDCSQDYWKAGHVFNDGMTYRTFEGSIPKKVFGVSTISV